MEEKEVFALCDGVRQASFALHRYLRHGHLENVYENGLAHRLRKAGVKAVQQHPLTVYDEDGAVVELADGRVLLDVRSIAANRRRQQTVSPDGATTWSRSEYHEQLYEAVCAVSMIRFSGGGDGRRNRLLFVNPYTPGVEEVSRVRG